MLKLTGLYESKDKNGNSVLTGKVGHLKFIIFKNNFKKSEKEPDFNLFIENTFTKEQKNESTNQKAGIDSQRGIQAAPTQEELEFPPFPTSDDIPF